MITGISWQALAVIVIELIDADTAVTAGIADALIYVDRAFRSRPSWLTGAIIATRLHQQQVKQRISIYVYESIDPLECATFRQSPLILLHFISFFYLYVNLSYIIYYNLTQRIY
jgi:hypothetical protein